MKDPQEKAAEIIYQMYIYVFEYLKYFFVEEKEAEMIYDMICYLVS